MSDTAHRHGLRRALALSTSREAVLALAAVALQAGAIVAYFGLTDARLISVRETLYPVIWVSFSVYFLLFVGRYGPSVRNSRLAVLVAVGYFLALAVVAGLLWPSHQLLGHHQHAGGLTVVWAPPGWGPTLLYGGSLVQVALVPFKVIAYGTLAYGVAAAVAGRSRGALAGVFGIFSCVGCILPLLAVFTGVFGGTGSVISAAGGSYEIATAVFVLTIAVLLVAIPTEDPLASENWA